MVNNGYSRKENIKKLNGKLEHLTNKLKKRQKPSEMLADLSQFSQLEKELEIQKAYLQHETQENNNG